MFFITNLYISKAQIESRVGELAGIWEKLAAASELKGSKLQEAAAQQQYNRAVEDIELWLSEVEGQLLSEDYGKVTLMISAYAQASLMRNYLKEMNTKFFVDMPMKMY